MMSTYCRYCTYLPASKKFIAEGQTRLSFPEKKLLRWNCIAPVRQKLISKEEGGKKGILVAGWLLAGNGGKRKLAGATENRKPTWWDNEREEVKQNRAMACQLNTLTYRQPPSHLPLPTFLPTSTHTQKQTRLTLPSWYKTSSKEGRTEKKRKKGETMCMKHTMSEGCNVSKHP